MNIKILIAIWIFFFWIIIWTFGFSYLENWSLIDSFYYSVTTLTTVGYWDIIPTTELSRFFAAIYILFWVTSVIWWSMAVIWSHTINKGNKKLKNKFKKNKKKKHN